jgi:molybdopterin molybdotransferase
MMTAGKQSKTMISFDQALQIIESSVSASGTEKVPLQKALNRILAEEVFSDIDMPPFNKAAMDGYACRRIDLGNELLLIEEIPAGKVPGKKIAPNQCARIMTGAMVPEGADYILMQEHAELKDLKSLRAKQQSDHDNICYKGEDLRAGDSILKTGAKLLPVPMAMLAAAGCVMPRVYKLPEIAVISTGDELVEPDITPVAGKIRNSNGLQLIAQARQFGLPADYLGIVPDNRKILLDTMNAALEKYQLVLISGGVSVGDYDFVPDIIRELQMEVLIQGMNVKPGKHLLLSRKGNQFVAGMPGNPVSSFVLFEVIVKPILRKLTGSIEEPVLLHVPLAKSYHRRNRDTLFFIPVSLTGEGTALPLEYHGSAHIHAYSGANGMMEVAVGINDIKEGEIVHVRPV